MKFVFLMDPLETVNIDKDTTFVFMLESSRRRHQVYFLPEGGIFRQEGKTYFNVSEVTPQRKADKPFIIKKKLTLSQDEVQAVFIRTDPPFDADYLLNTWHLDLLPKNIFVMNAPAGIRAVNEKIWASQFTGIVPPTFIGADKTALIQFVHRQRDVIAKPTNSYGGQGIFRIRKGDTNTNVILETLTSKWEHDCILQKYIPAAQKGDKRILLLDGEILGAVLRVHGKDDHRNNFFAGGKAHPARITDRDLEIVATLRPHLKKLGLYFVGIDVIGNYLIEVNVTSPTCLQEMNVFTKKNLERQVIDFVEKSVESRRSKVTIPSQGD